MMDPYETSEVIEEVTDLLVEGLPIEAIQKIVERYTLDEHALDQVSPA